MERTDSKQLRSAEKSPASERKRLEEEWESLATKGFKVALQLARLGDEASLVHLLTESKLAIKRAENLLRLIYSDEDKN
jgi:hypothetical protein